MNPFLGLLLLFFLLLFLLQCFRRRKIIKKIKHMTCEEKCCRLEALITPFGYSYNRQQDIFTSTLHPWQRQFGYGMIYDRFAPHFNMIFDSLPVYFDYAGKTWLIEFWKGQYGIHTGGEIGIYKSDKLLNKSQRKTEIFQAVSDEELLPLSMNLKYTAPNKKDSWYIGQPLASVSQLHWWLTAFKMGKFTNPGNLSMKVSLTFPDCDMLNAFTDSLTKNSFHSATLCINGLTVTFTFGSCPSCSYGFFKKLYLSFVQWKNLCLCRLFLHVTKPFTLSMDRVLYLYEYLPFAFHRTFCIHHYKRPFSQKSHDSSGHKPSFWKSSHKNPCQQKPQRPKRS